MREPPVEPRLAATVVLVRPGRGGPEVLLTRRPPSMAFAPNMHVFPGGRVDPGDAEPSLLARSVLLPSEAARALGGDLEPVLALAAHVAAIRELFEEAGVLLADTGAGAGTGAGDPVPTRSAALARSALVGGDATFATIAAELGLRLRTDLLVPLSRWVTPPLLPRRFDARFFAAELPARARVSFEGDEVAGHAWLTPAAALRAMADGELEMWLPTSATLQQLEHASSVAQMREDLAPGPLGSIDVEAIAPGGHSDRHAGRRRRRWPAGLQLSRRSATAHPDRPRRPHRPEPRSGDRGGGRARRLDPGGRPDPGRPGPCRRSGGPRGDVGHSGAGRSRRRWVAAVSGARAVRSRASRVVRHAHSGDPRARAQPSPSRVHLRRCGGGAGRFGGSRRAPRRPHDPRSPDESATTASCDRLVDLAPTAAWLSGHPAEPQTG